MLKNKVFAIAVLLILSSSILMTGFPAAYAKELNTAAFCAVEPNPVGVGQGALVNVWVQPELPTGTDVYHNLKVTITGPDGTTESRTMNTYTHGMNFFTYTPAQIGNYTFVVSYPGEYFASNDVNLKSSTSPAITLVVQNDLIPDWPNEPLPTDYWTRPISAENRLWSSVSGNWLELSYNSTYATWFPSCAYNPYSQAALAPHLMWTKSLDFGGLVGGEFGGTEYYTGLSYETKLPLTIIINGVLYYNIRIGSSLTQGFAAVDLRTGEELWRVMDDTLRCGQLFNFNSGNQFGVNAYLWSMGSTYKMYDAFTGQLTCSFANASTGTILRGDDGTIYVYILDGANGWLAMWNSTKAFQNEGMLPQYPGSPASIEGASLLEWRPRSGTFDWRKGIEWNTTVPIEVATSLGAVYYPQIQAIVGDVLVAFAGDAVQRIAGFPRADEPLHVGYSTKTGQLLWAFNRTTEHSNDGWVCAFGDGMYADWDTLSMSFVGYDASTGIKKWVSDPLVYPWGDFTTRHMVLIANNKLFVGAYDGYIHAFDIANGKEIWKFSSGKDNTTETPYGTWPWFHGIIIAGGVVYSATGDHSPTSPLIRNQRLFAINETTGEGIWSLTGLDVLSSMADGYIVGYNAYTNQMFSIGKGPSKITVSAPQTALTLGQSVVITGTVTDQSAGTKDTPAISDESMGAWMDYIYAQKTIPTDAKGVQVRLDVIDSNNNYRNIGTVTSDITGAFGYTWKPDISGQYTVIATFEGSNSYGSSSARTYMSVEEASQATSAQTSTPASMADLYFLPMSIGLIVAMAVVIALLALLLLKKRP